MSKEKSNMSSSVKTRKLKKLSSKNIAQFIKENNRDLNFKLNLDHKVKLCSSDKYDDTVKSLEEEYIDTKSPIIIGQVSGFYETATLGGLISKNKDENDKPFILFFDRETNNIQNAIFNSLLMKLSDSKEEYITNLFSLDRLNILKALKPKQYYTWFKEIVKENFIKENKDNGETEILEEYFTEEDVENIMLKEYLTDEVINIILTENFNFKKLVNYIITEFSYDPNKHYELLLKLVEGKLKGDVLNLYKKIARNICEYLSYGNNFEDFATYLLEDTKRNKEHILNNDKTFNGFKSLIKENATGNIKFLSNIDINKYVGLNDLESILEKNGLISKEENYDDFPIDIAYIPHMYRIKHAYPFVKKYVNKFVSTNRQQRDKNGLIVSNSSVALEINDHKKIGAQFILEERENHKPLTHLDKIEPLKGFPLISFIAGANFGNIYHSEVDTRNMIDMAIANNIDTMYIGGLIYATYYHYQTSRRQLTDPSYETLESRLEAAQGVVKKLNDNKIRVVYQMGDEEAHLSEDMFKLYLREIGVKYKDWLSRPDLRVQHDWIKPIIKQKLIPYMIRSGKDIAALDTDNPEKTEVLKACLAIKAYEEGLSSRYYEKFINPKYLEDTGLFKVVFGLTDNFNKDDPALSVKLITNPNFSDRTQYGSPEAGLKKRIKTMQSGAIRGNIKEMPQLIVDNRQAHMALEVMDRQVALNVPQMIKDEWYIEHEDELLPGVKDSIKEDPTKKRVTQAYTKINSPGGWTTTGDVREIQRILPYYRRVRDVLEYVQKTGKALPEISTFHWNDTQFGSPTERITYFLKALDYWFYTYKARGIIGNGDFCQGWNYAKFANESRHLGSASVSQQMIDTVKLIRPWMEVAFGYVSNDLFEIEDPKNNIKIDSVLNNKIIEKLLKNNLIEEQKGTYGRVYAINKNVDYKTVDLQLPVAYKKYESHIREKLSRIKYLWFFHLVEGNHEYNTDWHNKGYRLAEHIKQDLENLRNFAGSDTEIILPEYFINDSGDIVNAYYGSKTINGYNLTYGHMYKTPGKGSGGSATRAMANYFEQMGTMSHPYHRAYMAHLHHYETAVINNMTLSVTGGAAGQSGFEQNLGYKSKPIFVIDTYLPDGRIQIDTLGIEFLKNWKIKNPYVASIGLNNFINKCLTQEVPVLGPDEPEDMQEIYTRKLKPLKPNQVIGPNIS